MSAPVTAPIEPERTASVPAAKRSDDALNSGTPRFAARRWMATASASDPASGLSTNTRLPALITGITCSRWGRPSLVSRRTASTRSRRTGMPSTISTPCFFTSAVYSGTRLTLDSISALPCGDAATTRQPATCWPSAVSLSSFVKAVEWEVSRPMMPTRIGFSFSTGSAAVAHAADKPTRIAATILPDAVCAACIRSPPRCVSRPQHCRADPGRERPS